MNHHNETIRFLQHLLNHGPSSRWQIAESMGENFSWVQAKIDYCRQQDLIIGTPQNGEKGYIYAVSDGGRRRLRLEVGEVTPPRTIAREPWVPLQELQWPTVRPGGNDFLRHETRGYA